MIRINMVDDTYYDSDIPIETLERIMEDSFIQANAFIKINTTEGKAYIRKGCVVSFCEVREVI